jgi:CHASE3 domain sensor protein
VSPQFASHEALSNLGNRVTDIANEHRELRDRCEAHTLALAAAMEGVKLQLQALRWIGVTIAGGVMAVVVAVVIGWVVRR